jgi:hypothetical protein
MRGIAVIDHSETERAARSSRLGGPSSSVFSCIGYRTRALDPLERWGRG